MNPAWIAWGAALLPLLAVHTAYWLSADAGYVPWCLPYLDGCTSISRAARHGLPNLLFKGLMLPYAAWLAATWALVFVWLRLLRPQAPRRTCTVLILGIVAAIFLVLYATFLGAEGPAYQWLRRYGITVYFSFTVLAQMFVSALLWPLATVPRALRRAMACLCALLLLLGLASLPLQHYAHDADAAIDALEWTYALLMIAFFPLVALAWQRTGFRLRGEIVRKAASR
ncbi:MAG TPA: hypothetical protein VGE57_03795 [Solimonas sp.]